LHWFGSGSSDPIRPIAEFDGGHGGMLLHRLTFLERPES
jgi:hypothetical protein